MGVSLCVRRIYGDLVCAVPYAFLQVEGFDIGLVCTWLVANLQVERWFSHSNLLRVFGTYTFCWRVFCLGLSTWLVPVSEGGVGHV
jgi:hypothetical protein